MTEHPDDAYFLSYWSFKVCEGYPRFENFLIWRDMVITKGGRKYLEQRDKREQIAQMWKEKKVRDNSRSRKANADRDEEVSNDE